MNGKGDSRSGQRRIDGAAKAQFLEALRRGERREDAAHAAGFSLMGFYGARRRDPAFRADWREGLATSAAAERRSQAYAERGRPGERGELRLSPVNRRIYQRRWRRNVRFDAKAQAVFLAYFALTCDTKASAAVAGVSVSTVTLHCRTDPVFAEAYRQALMEGYIALEAEAVRQRLAAQQRLREAIETAGDGPPLHLQGRGTAEGGGGACPHCGRAAEDPDAEFDRVMKLLARWDRKPRNAERVFKPGSRRHRPTFDEAIRALDRWMRGIGARSGPPLGSG